MSSVGRFYYVTLPPPTFLEALLNSPRGQFDLVDLTDWLAELRTIGWSSERLAKNDLPVWLIDEAYYPYRFDELWVTAAEIAHHLRILDIEPIILKCLREYPYVDSNVDVLIPRSRWTAVTEQLASGGWVVPSLRERLEQKAFERGKMKLGSGTSNFLAAHLYAAVSWRYLDDLGILRNGETPLREALIRHPGNHFAAASRPEDWFYLPSPSAELVIQAAHICFENYRITLGEAAHIVLLRHRVPEAWREAVQIAQKVGCSRALQLVYDSSVSILTNLGEAKAENFPKPLAAWSLLRCFAERERSVRRTGNRVRGALEFAGSVAFFFGVRVIRAIRRRRMGREDYRRPSSPRQTAS